MKKAFTIFLSLFMLLSTVGISVSRHYCGDFLKDVAIFSHVDDCGDMDMPMDCCHDEIDYFEIQDDFQTTQLAFDLAQEYSTASFIQFSITDNISQLKDINYSFVESPLPPIIGRNIYIQVQSFLI